MTYLAIVNVPGYLPMNDDPPEFDTIAGAWWCLYHERCDDESDWIIQTGLCPVCGQPYDDDHDDDSETAKALAEMARKGELGVMVGDTVGYDGDHDLGFVYSVVAKEES